MMVPGFPHGHGRGRERLLVGGRRAGGLPLKEAGAVCVFRLYYDWDDFGGS